MRRRLTGWLLAGLFAILVSGGAVFYASVRSILLSEFDSALLMKAQALAGLVKWQENGIEFDFADEQMPSFEREENPEFFQIWLGPGSAEGSAMERSESLGGIDLPERTGPSLSPEFWNLLLPGNLPGRAVGIQFRPENESADVRSKNFIEYGHLEVKLVVAKDRTELDASLRAIGGTIVATFAAILGLTAIIVGLAVSRGLEPLDTLGARVGSIDAMSLSERLPSDSMPAELRPICSRLNDLLARLDASFQRERRFSADVAHELRTPIAELRSLAEVALKYPKDVAAGTGPFQDALDIALQMEKTVSTLLLLVRCQSGLEAVHDDSVGTTELLHDVWRPLAAAIRKKNLVVRDESPGELTIRTDLSLFRIIIQNLLSNAVEYSPEGGAVGILATAVNGDFQFQVENSCDTLTQDDLPKLFDPFWRKDAARSSASHSGLGLTLASECARILSMELDAELTADHRLRVALRQRQAISASPGPSPQ